MPTLSEQSVSVIVWEALGLQPDPEWSLSLSWQSTQDIIQFKANITGNAVIVPDNKHIKLTTIHLNGKWLYLSGIIYPDVQFKK